MRGRDYASFGRSIFSGVSCDDPFFFFFLKTYNESSQWHDYMLLSQHTVHILYVLDNQSYIYAVDNTS